MVLEWCSEEEQKQRALTLLDSEAIRRGDFSCDDSLTAISSHALARASRCCAVFSPPLRACSSCSSFFCSLLALREDGFLLAVLASPEVD
jgi:hypothetical protein